MNHTKSTIELAILYKELLEAGIIKNLEELLRLIKSKEQEINLKKNI